MSLPSYFDWRSREKKESRLAKYLDYTPNEDFLNTDDLDVYMKAIKSRQDENKRISKMTPLEQLEYYERKNQLEDNLINPKEIQEPTTTKYDSNEPIYLILENRLGFQLTIKTELIKEYTMPNKDKSQNKCDYLILIMKIADIEQLEYGAMEFIKKAQIFNVYQVYKDGKKEKVTVPWKDNYMEMVNSLQVVTVGQDEIIIEIGV